jgi:glycosyltransferase involved in cell wall biosynthesis
MHVGVEAVGSRIGGGWSVLTRTLAALADDPRLERITVYCSPTSTWAGPAPRFDHLFYRPRPAEHRSLSRRVVWYQRGLRRVVARDRADVVLCLNGMGLPGTPHVNLVQQAMLCAPWRLRRPAPFGVKLAAIGRATARSCSQASSVVAQTSWMRGCIMERFELSNVAVLPLGLPTTGRVPAAVERDRHILVVTSPMPYKNNRVMREAFATLRRQFPRLLLHVVGTDWDGEGIVSHRRVSPDTLTKMYARASLMVFPSLVESMGLPLVEAMAIGCPIVASERPYARDVCDNAALFFDPRSPDDLVRVAGEVLRSEALASDLARRGARQFARLQAACPGRRVVDLLVEAA